MDWGGPNFVVAIVALSMGAWVFTTWIRAKHGYPLEDDWGRKIEKSDNQDTKQLEQENIQLRSRLEDSEDRLAVLERIVTDRGYTLADEIEALRKSDSGTPLNIAKKERL